MHAGTASRPRCRRVPALQPKDAAPDHGRADVWMRGEVRRVTATQPPCPRASKHTKHPAGYLQKYSWARRKVRTHRQVRCEGCGLFVIWVRK